MSTPPGEPQLRGPLHNFSLPQLKWSKNHSNNLRRGRWLGESSSQQSPSANATNLPSRLSISAHRPCSSPDLAFRSESANAGSSSAPESVKKVFFSSQCDHIVEKSRKKAPEGNSSKTEHVIEKSHTSFRAGFKEEVDEDEQKHRNLRPTKPQRKPRSSNPGACKVDGATLQDKTSPLPPVSRGSGEDKVSPKTAKKPTFSLSLLRTEIEEDIFSMTGSRLSRKPKKRPKAVQKQLDSLFPGMLLASVTPDAYKVQDASKRRRKK